MNDQARKIINSARLDLTLPDGYRTYCVFYDAAAGVARRRPVLYMHGIQSHPGWFAGSAGAFAAAGFPVYQVVRRGNGGNSIDRGHAKSASQLLDDVDAAVDFILAQERQHYDAGAGAGEGKVNLLGVSWGGKLLASYCLGAARLARVENLVLVAPGIVPQVDVSLITKFALAVNLLVGGKGRFAIPLNDVELFTDNPAWRQFLQNDPLRLNDATARFMFASRMLDFKLKKAQAGSLNVKATLLLAGRDRIINNDLTENILKKLAGDKLQVYKLDAAHTIEFEESPQEFYEILISSLK